MMMDSRQRVLSAIDHQPVDRVPLDLGGTRVTSIHPTALASLRQELGLEYEPPKVMDVWQMVAWVDQPVAQALGVDVLPVPRLNMEFGMRLDRWMNWELPLIGSPQVGVAYGRPTSVRISERFAPRVETDGRLLLYLGDKPVAVMVPGSAYFDALIEQSMRYSPPSLESLPLSPFSDEELAWRRQWAETLRSETDKFLMGDFGVNLGRWGSYQEWLLHIAANPEWTLAWYERKVELLLQDVQLYYEAVGENIDGIYLMEDFGTQDSMLVSPTMWRKMIKPFYQRFFTWIKQNTGWKIFFHSDGAIYPIIQDLIEIGVDILNPPQTNAKGMEPQRLKNEFGDRLTFWGAGVETQDVLPFGRPDQVRGQVLERMKIFSPGGGYVFSTIHNIQHDVPIENILAVYAAYREFCENNKI
jgi:hypothetical protein